MIHVFIGTKAQLIKMAPIMRELQDRGLEYNFIFSGQHQSTISELRHNFGIKEPDVVLYSGRDVTSILKMVYWLLHIIVVSIVRKKKVWRGDKNGVVLNHGDTFSTLAGSLLARLAGHRSAHVESGLRSFDLFNPFPEELTRIAVFRLSSIYFCQNDWALGNLSKYSGAKILTNGNTLYDSLNFILKLAAGFDPVGLPDRYGIVSFHRFENIFKESQLIDIVELLEEICKQITILVIMHKPTKVKLAQFGLLERLERNSQIQLHARYDYQKFIYLIRRAEFVITDGGSNQEECFYLGKPCLLLRKATERQEGIGGNVLLSNFDMAKVKSFVKEYQSYCRPEVVITPSPSQVIVDYLVRN